MTKRQTLMLTLAAMFLAIPLTVVPSLSAQSVTPMPTESTLNLKLKFQGITGQGQNKQITVLIKSGPTTVFSEESIDATSDNSGIYQANVIGAPVGTYDIYIKDQTHLQRKFGNINLIAGVNDIDLSANPLKVGDFNNDNKITILDIAQILSQCTAISVPVKESNSIFDVNGDSVIDPRDTALALTNYTQLEVLGD